jgi:hypothetical protein
MIIRSGKGVCVLFFAIGIQFVAADNYNVINTSDSGPGSLRQAILDANMHANINANTPDTISFIIPGAGLQTIIPLSTFPTITDPVVIDGFTQPGSSANTMAVGDSSVHLIELNGNGANFRALEITAGNSTVRGLVINRFNGNGPANAINLLTKGGNKIEGCFIGVSADGTTAQSNNGLAIDIESSPNNTIGGTTPAARNVISSNHGASSANILIVGASSSGTTIQGNYIGTNAAGTADTGGNTRGVQIGRGSGDGSSNNIIGGTTAAARNVISGNTGGGGIVLFDDIITGNKIQGNYIGTNAAGTAAVGNGTGIVLDSTNDTTIGGTVAGAGNLISGNGFGINLGGNGDAKRNLIQGNLIGTDATGTAKVGNNGGIVLVGSNNTIGGTAPGARNIVSGSSIGHGIVFKLFSTTAGNLIQGNYIGTDINGTAALGNAADGIQISAFEPPTGANTIGGTSAAARNIISANSVGIELSGQNILIQGNYIGTDVNGTADLGNGTNGITIFSGNNNTIGGSAPGAGNTIAFNGKLAPGTNSRNGVAVFSFAIGNTIRGNSIFANLRLGIDLSGGTENASGVTANDSCDSDDGANNLQNFPVLKSVTNTPGSVNITGTLNSTANTTFSLEFFRNDAIDPSGFGEGQVFLGFANVTTDANCNAVFNVNFPSLVLAQRVTATATDPSGNTSEFSAAIGQLLNISTRLKVDTGDNVLIGGFIITGSDPKKVIIRGIGPSLSGTVQGFLADPTLELHQGGATLATNDNWKTRPDGSSQQAEIEATTIPPTNDLESALVATLPANGAGYTAIVRGKNNTTGIGVVEAYDLDQAANSKLANISTRGFVETGNNVLIGGFIAGNGITKVIVRAIGPTLVNAGVTNPLADPTLELHDGNGTTIRSNNNWKVREDGSSQQAEIEATTIPPTNDLESALVQTLTPGNYTAVVRGINGTTGIAVVEVYNIQ